MNKIITKFCLIMFSLLFGMGNVGAFYLQINNDSKKDLLVKVSYTKFEHDASSADSSLGERAFDKEKSLLPRKPSLDNLPKSLEECEFSLDSELSAYQCEASSAKSSYEEEFVVGTSYSACLNCYLDKIEIFEVKEDRESPSSLKEDSIFFYDYGTKKIPHWRYFKIDINKRCEGCFLSDSIEQRLIGRYDKWLSLDEWRYKYSQFIGPGEGEYIERKRLEKDFGGRQNLDKFYVISKKVFFGEYFSPKQGFIDIPKKIVDGRITFSRVEFYGDNQKCSSYEMSCEEFEIWLDDCIKYYKLEDCTTPDSFYKNSSENSSHLKNPT